MLCQSKGMANAAEVKLNMIASVKVHDSKDPDADPTSHTLEKFHLHETRARFYLVGSDRNKSFFRVLKIDRSEPSDLNLSEDRVVYSSQEIKNLLERIAEGNRATGGLNFVTKVYGIAGCIKFLESYYLILVTKRRQIGCICGHAIYTIDDSELVPIPHVSIQTSVAHSKNELRYRKLLSSVVLTKGFFYSYTYPIMQSLQKNVLSSGEEGMPYDNMFVWNSYLTQAIRSRCNNTIWTLALVHGHFEQIRLSVFGRDFSVSLVARRSRHFAGTRYLKRGVNDRGRVANDVETEQIVLDEAMGSCMGKMSSVVQMRGSIPLFWSQEVSKFPKPDIILQRYDPTYQATKLHFEDLIERYGNPIIVLNLIKTVEKRPREMMLRREYANAVGYLNQILSQDNHVRFIHWDFHKFAKSKSANVLAVLGNVARQALDLTSFYYSGKPSDEKQRGIQCGTSFGRDASLRELTTSSGVSARLGSSNETLSSSVNQDKQPDCDQNRNDNFYGEAPCFQNGIMRTNCIDCLDRTNVAQYAYGLAALGRQLCAMGLSNMLEVDPHSTIAEALMDMYQSMGDALAQQYGGSEAHNTIFTERKGKWKAMIQSREFFKSIKRYYSNTCTDGEKQDAMNLFLGYFKPQEGKPALWELESDYYLHVTGIGDDLFPDRCLETESKHVGGRVTLSPIPACREDFLRIKLTSFHRLMERSCSLIKNVRLCHEPNQRPGGCAGSHRVAPDAVEMLLQSPNWLFGQRKHEDSCSSPKVTLVETYNGESTDEKGIDCFLKQYWVSSGDDGNDEDITHRYLAMSFADKAKGCYSEILVDDQVESSEIYKHFAQLCEGPAMEAFLNETEQKQRYGDVLQMDTIAIVDAATREEMEAALKEYDQISADLGIGLLSYKSLAGDQSWLARWIIREDQLTDHL